MEEARESEPKKTKIITIDPLKSDPAARNIRSYDDGTPVSHPEMPNLKINPNDVKEGDITAFPPPDKLSQPMVYVVEETLPNSEFPEDPRVRRLFVDETYKIRQLRQKERKPFPDVAFVFKKAA